MEKNISSPNDLRIYIRDLWVSPFKMKQVISLVKKKEIGKSINAIQFLSQKGSKILTKMLQNIHKQILSREENKSNNAFFYINQIKVDPGRNLKRRMIRAKGSTDSIRKSNCHIFIWVKKGEKS